MCSLRDHIEDQPCEGETVDYKIDGELQESRCGGGGWGVSKQCVRNAAWVTDFNAKARMSLAEKKALNQTWTCRCYPATPR